MLGFSKIVQIFDPAYNPDVVRELDLDARTSGGVAKIIPKYIFFVETANT